MRIDREVEQIDREVIIQYGRQFFKGDKMFLHCTESRWETKRQRQIHWNMRLSAHKFSFYWVIFHTVLNCCVSWCKNVGWRMIWAYWSFTFFASEARFKRRTLHVPNLMQMRKIYCFRSFALDSAHEKFDVWTGPERIPFLVFSPGVAASARRSIKERVGRRCEYISYR